MVEGARGHRDQFPEAGFVGRLGQLVHEVLFPEEFCTTRDGEAVRRSIGSFTTEVTEDTEGKSVFSILTCFMHIISCDIACTPLTVMTVYDGL